MAIFLPLLLLFSVAHGSTWDYENVLSNMGCGSWCTTNTAQMRTLLEDDAQTQCSATEVYQPLSDVVECVTCDAQTVDPGYYCDNGERKLCKIGHYCPSATEQIKCKEGTWCKEGFTEALDCRPMIKCDAGAEVQKPGGGLLFGMIIFFFFLCGCSTCITRRNNRSREAMRDAAARIADTEEVDFSAELKLDVPKLTIEFEKLSMHLKVNGKKVLDNVTGKFPESSLVALMGPSGGGKTTFMNALCGRAQYGDVTGITKINGEVGEVTQFPKSVGFVPQDDIMHADLTVQQNVYYNAKLRLPAGTDEEAIMNHTNQVVKVLGLSHVSQSLVGSPEKRGISGGQKKRVNIGIELAAMPAVIFMDEPTSGLDGAATIQLAQILKKLRSSGLLIVCVIHQPRYAVFAEFSHLLLLGAGGGQCYCGRTHGMEEYFTKLGFRCPPRENVADWMIDVTCGLAPKYKSPGSNEIDDTFTAPGSLFQYWEEYKGKKTPWDGEDDDKPIAAPMREDRVTPGVCAQMLMFLTRESRKWSKADFLSTILLLFFAGTALGIVLQAMATFAYSAILPILQSPASLFYMICTINTRTIYAAERLEFLREFSAGTSCTAYWLAKTVWSCINWIMYPFAFALPLYWLMPLPAQSFGTFFYCYLMASWYHIGLGMMITLSYPNPMISLMYCTFIPIILELAASGAVTPIRDLTGPFKLLSALSCGRWFKSGIFAYELSKYPSHVLTFDDVNNVFLDYEADVDSGPSAMMSLFIVGLLMRLYCWLTLYLLQNAQGTGCVSRIYFLIKKKLHTQGISAGSDTKQNDVAESDVVNRAPKVGVPMEQARANTIQVKPNTTLLGKKGDATE